MMYRSAQGGLREQKEKKREKNATEQNIYYLKC